MIIRTRVLKLVNDDLKWMWEAWQTYMQRESEENDVSFQGG
jgi:hypothetical protein